VTKLAARAAGRMPHLAAAAWLYRLLRKQASAYASAGADPRSFEELLEPLGDDRLLGIRSHELIDLRIATGPVVASQKFDELAVFLQRARELRPQRVCEIGTSAAGTLYALTRIAEHDAVLISVDIEISPQARELRARLARGKQRIVSINGDSHDEQTRARVEQELGGLPIDVLFIDGDHSYEGVRADFDLYSPLVRPGGVIGLHDINEDYSTRHGTPTPSVSGEVPRYWRELKARSRTEELISDPEHDGFGIGIVYPS